MNSKAIRKQLLAAVAMVLVAAVALGSSTYAWFAAQNDVTATGMSVKAQGESGIVIRHEKYDGFETDGVTPKLVATNWATTANAGMNGAPKELKPTSTINLSNWYHAISDEMDKARDKQTYDKYTPVAEKNYSEYFLKTQFAIRSAQAGVPITDKDLAVKEVSVALPTAGQTSPNLNKAIRVGVQIGDEFYIYSPLNAGGFTLTANYTMSATITTAQTLVEKETASATTDTFNLANDTIPADDATALKAFVYIWFEGEDPMCKSTNITASVDELKVTVGFTTITPITKS